MLTAITRAVSPAIVHCELSFIDRKPIDLATAQEQHHAYEKLLGEFGARIISLPAEPDLPDSMFVEDPAIVLDELAVILPLGTETRRREAPSLAEVLSQFRKLEYVSLPGTLEGGDVLRIGRKLFVGLTRRSNAEGIRQLAAILVLHNYEVIAVPVTGCLHLKSAVTSLGRNTLLANRAWFNGAPLAGYEWIDVDPAEPHAANALALGGTVIFPASFPRTRARIRSRWLPRHASRHFRTSKSRIRPHLLQSSIRKHRLGRLLRRRKLSQPLAASAHGLLLKRKRPRGNTPHGRFFLQLFSNDYG